MTIKKHIPNLLTLANLFCGTVATIFVINNDFVTAALFVVIGIFIDFFDGFAARLLNVTGELGKQLDSLADVVTSGVVPGLIMYKLIENNINHGFMKVFENSSVLNYSLIGLILTLGACYRLAKFNIDTRQTNSFIGLPTPAMSLFVISLPLINQYSEIELIINLLENNYFLIFITLFLTYLMNAEIPLFSLKFKDFTLKSNWKKYMFLLVSILLIAIVPYLSIPLIITFYVVVSIINNSQKKG